MEKYIFKYIQDLQKNNKRVTTLIIFKMVSEMHTLFKCGKETK